MASGGFLLALLIWKEWKNMETSRKQETGLKGEQKWEQVASGVWKVRFGTPSAYTPTAHRSNEIKTQALSALSAEQGAEPQLPFGADAVKIKQTKRGIVVTLPMNTNEDIFGFGLQLQSVNAAGRKRYIKVNSDPKMDTGESQLPDMVYLWIHIAMRHFIWEQVQKKVPLQ